MVSEKPRVTLSGEPAQTDDVGAPAPVNPETGMHGDYWVLPPEERAKGFVRPVRRTYVHAGPSGPKVKLRDLTEDEHLRYSQYGYVKYEAYPESESPVMGRYWTQKQLDQIGQGCGVATTMAQELAETYARDPSYYGSTFCVGCKTHLPVNEFVWDPDGSRVGS